jgi:8-oxo-dGTP pyrophosphatase MutT (NUDIX family)
MNNYSKNNILINRKKIIKDISCTNCGSRRHTYKQCSEPITSWGIILITYGDLKKPIHNNQIDLIESELSDTQNRVLIESENDRFVVSKAYHNIMFLMISRKHSVGYVEFIRGKYRPEKIDQVIYLFKQMMQSEIDKINISLEEENGFEYLWKDFWGNKSDSQYLLKDKSISKINYELLKIKGVDGPELDLKYIVTTVKPEYDTEEWGFPKGRRNKSETEEECAIREFKEETGYSDEDIKLIPEIKPLVEEFIGTNGINYKHVYYIAELISDKQPRNDITESQKDEIGNIQFMNFTSAYEFIREYHIPRKIILSRLFTYYIDKLVLANRENEKDLLVTKKNKIINKMEIMNK